MTNPPPGWHSDPRDPRLVRWWDGQQWTDATQPASGAIPPVAPGATRSPQPQPGHNPQPQSEPGKPRNWKTTAAKIVGGIVAVYLVAVACNAVVFADNDTSTSAATTTRSSADKQAEEAADRARYNESLALTQAELDCKTLVEQALVSPASAEYTDIASRRLASGGIVTVGAVDSDNAFGAAIRSTFSCSTNAGNTTLEYLE
ncbi:uncharacterized protein DUF2510 [Rhodococcus rhodochrous J38]|uniref:DUF2510 domain-containing protein n=1 Tax=Rhodococcus rhodochrous TaxID=1829 RepID=UPI0011AC03B3|nr:DUF2510 domain-containing protein [Rhodococcus rhodochrous]TWH63209.1 uncharacterized protein DUF2510 [Rhodococcus rhodochrous J38]